jgi:hypothetical protein
LAGSPASSSADFKNRSEFALSEKRSLPIFTGMVIFAIAMIVLGVLAAVGFFIANRSQTQNNLPTEDSNTNEDIVTYLAAEVPAILHEVLASVPLATVEEAMVGCYGLMGATATTQPAAGQKRIRPYQTESLDELVVRTMEAVTQMESEQPIAKFTISTQAKSRMNPHVELLAHSAEPKRIRMIRFWRTGKGFITTLPD